MIVVFLCLAASVLLAAEAGVEPSPSPPTRPMSTVFGMERPDESDVLLLWNGEQLSGTLLNKTVGLRTSGGLIEFPIQVLVGIDFNHGGGGLESVVTVNSNRFSGFVEDARYTLQLPAGDRIEVRRERVARIVFHRRQAELEGLPQGRWICLKNGDSFSGQVMTDPLLLSVSNAQMRVSMKEVGSLSFAPGTNSLVDLRLRNGDRLQGTMVSEDFAIQLDIGPQISLFQNRIDRIADRLDAPMDSSATTHQAAGSVIPGGFSTRAGPTNLAGMVWIPAGEFTSGSPSDEVGRDQDEGPQTQVVIAQGFWMGKCEVTQAEYQAVMGTNPSINTEDPQRPVEKVSWQEAMEYCTQLTQRAQATGQLTAGWVFRLPTEAEWEYACRAGTMTRFSFGDDKGYAKLGEYAWFGSNSSSMAHPVGTKRPNSWGLFDMHGNVWEWCLDRWEASLPGGRITNTAVAGEGSLRGARGGSWLYDGRACRSANRDDYSPSNRCSDLGFRVVLAPLQP